MGYQTIEAMDPMKLEFPLPFPPGGFLMLGEEKA